jgi:hypothetical protein
LLELSRSVAPAAKAVAQTSFHHADHGFDLGTLTVGLSFFANR